MNTMKTPSSTAQNATRSGRLLICVLVRLGRRYGSGRPVICTVLRLTASFLFRAPTGLAVGLALKELRYAEGFGDSPQAQRPGHLDPPCPLPWEETSAMDARHRSSGRRRSRWGNNGRCRLFLACDGGHVSSDGFCILALEQPGGHPLLARPAHLDRVQDAFLGHLADFV